MHKIRMHRIQTKRLVYGLTVIFGVLTFAVFLATRSEKAESQGWSDIILAVISLAAAETALLCSFRYFFSKKEKRLYKTVFCVSFLLQAMAILIWQWITIVADQLDGAFWLTRDLYGGRFIYVPLCLRTLLVYGAVNCAEIILRKITGNRLIDIIRRNKVWSVLSNIAIVAGSVLAIGYQLGDSCLAFVVLYLNGFRFWVYW